MERISPKIEIINHFDNLINKIDIDIDSSLEKLNVQQLLSDLLTSSEKDRKNFRDSYDLIDVYCFRNTIDTSKQNSNSWPKSTKVVDYLKKVRIETIEELKRQQKETLDFYKLNSGRFKRELSNEKNIDELKSELFADNFYFQVNLKQSEKRFWAFNLFTFVTDFYMPQFYIDLLEKLINDEKTLFDKDTVIDDKMVLTALLFKWFINNLLNFPNHVIHISKQDVTKIETINFSHDYSAVNLTSSSTIDLSKLVNLYLIDRTNDTYLREPVKFNIEGLSSLKNLHLKAKTSEVEPSIKNLPSLTIFYLSIVGTIDENILKRLLDELQHVQELYLDGNLSHFNLNSLVNLRELSLSGTIDENFNFDLFKILCNQLETIKIELNKTDENNFVKLFDGYNFPYLIEFRLRNLNLEILKKEFLNRFPTLRKLIISNCNIKVIEYNAFSDLEQLCVLDLSRNGIKFIQENAFLNLKNLREVNLNFNNLRFVDRESIGLRKSVEFSIFKGRFKR